MYDDEELEHRIVATLERMSVADPVEETLVAVRARAARRRSARTLARAFAVAAVVVAVALSVALVAADRDEADPASAAGTVLDVPAVGEVAGELLDDGTPVFVRHDPSGEVFVFRGFSTHTPFGQRLPIGWCERAQIFEDWTHGSKYDRRGNKLDGPAPRGLDRYSVEVRADGSIVVIADDPEPGTPLNTEGRDPPVGPPCSGFEGPGSLLVAPSTAD